MRTLAFALAVVVLSAAPSLTQPPAAQPPLAQPPSGAWADKLFLNKTTHDFSTVAKGSQLKYSFPIKNIYAVPLEITNIRPSCGCVSPTPSKKIL
jgi:hypothetical protein